jgi:hypothetical protein
MYRRGGRTGRCDACHRWCRRSEQELPRLRFRLAWDHPPALQTRGTARTSCGADATPSRQRASVSLRPGDARRMAVSRRPIQVRAQARRRCEAGRGRRWRSQRGRLSPPTQLSLGGADAPESEAGWARVFPMWGPPSIDRAHRRPVGDSAFPAAPRTPVRPARESTQVVPLGTKCAPSSIS